MFTDESLYARRLRLGSFHLERLPTLGILPL